MVIRTYFLVQGVKKWAIIRHEKMPKLKQTRVGYKVAKFYTLYVPKLRITKRLLFYFVFRFTKILVYLIFTLFGYVLSNVCVATFSCNFNFITYYCYT